MIRDKAFYQTLLRLSLPAAFQSLISLLVVLADNLMVSYIDGQGLAFAAVVQSNSITNLVIAFLTGLSSGSIVLISQYWGRKDHKRIQAIGGMVLALNILVALFFILLINLFPRQILQIVINGKETEAIRLARSYLPLVSLSYLPYAVTASLIGLLKGMEVVRVAVYTALTALIVNIGLNYLLIFGALGFPALGVPGAALATLLARLIEMTVVIYYSAHVQKTLPINLSMLRRQQGWAWRDFIKFGLPVGLTDAQWAMIGMFKMVIIGQMGVLMSTAAGVADALMNLGTLFTFALAGGAAVMVGKAVGARDYKLVRAYSSTIQVLFLLIGLLMAGLVFLVRIPFIRMHALPLDTARLAEKMISLCALTLIGTSYHASCFIGINRGAGDNRFVMKVDLICGWLIVLPLSALSAFVFKLPMALVYFMTRIDQTFKWIIAFKRLRGNKWIHHVTRDDPEEPAESGLL